ncbi:WD40 repeat domain-containing protein [Micromonospora sp. CPCC 205556]|uniref:WD40 repeat domain-containing protein n=1 Tax=Micromonospora sp. CPCC 205556 TaxID=3122398 RepID=UPI002FF261A6
MTGALRQTLAGHNGSVLALVAAPDESWLASGGPDGTVQIWDPIIGTLRRSLAGHGGWVPLHSGCSSKQERHQRAYRSASAMDVFEQPGMPLDEPGEAVVDHRVEHGPRLSLQGVAVLGRDLVQAGRHATDSPLQRELDGLRSSTCRSRCGDDKGQAVGRAQVQLAFGPMPRNPVEVDVRLSVGAVVAPRPMGVLAGEHGSQMVVAGAGAEDDLGEPIGRIRVDQPVEHEVQ